METIRIHAKRKRIRRHFGTNREQNMLTIREAKRTLNFNERSFKVQ